MISVNVKNGYDLNIKGTPSEEIINLPLPSHVASLPEKIPYIKPRLRIKKGDQVNVGSVLFEDKRNPDILFRSPGGGEIQDIIYGPRRVIEQIIIKRDQEEKHEAFDKFSEADIKNMTRDDLVKAIIKGGLWHIFRELPFRDIPEAETIPPAIFVPLVNSEPFHPLPQVYLKGNTDLFLYGLAVLKKLSKETFIYSSKGNSIIPDQVQNTVTHQVTGPYPSHDPGVVLYHTKKDAGQNQSWFISGQDLLLLSHLLKNGTYPVERTVAVGGSMVKNGQHVLTRIGAPIAHLIPEKNHGTNTRYITGGVFTGFTAEPDSHLGFYETAITLLPQGGEDEFLGFIRPGINKPSHSRTFLSFFKKSACDMDCSMHGEERACVNCSSCAKVCPVDILPQFTMKSILAEEIEEFLSHGLLDCISCGLCTYVCPSKIDLKNILNQAKENYHKEKV